MPTNNTSEDVTLYALNSETGEYKKVADTICEINFIDSSEEPEVIETPKFIRPEDFTATITIKPQVVVDVEYKEIECDDKY